MKFTAEQRRFMESIGLAFNFDRPTDDQLVLIENAVGDALNERGLNKDYQPNATGRLCYSILDLLA